MVSLNDLYFRYIIYYILKKKPAIPDYLKIVQPNEYNKSYIVTYVSHSIIYLCSYCAHNFTHLKLNKKKCLRFSQNRIFRCLYKNKVIFS